MQALILRSVLSPQESRVHFIFKCWLSWWCSDPKFGFWERILVEFFLTRTFTFTIDFLGLL